MLAAGRIHGVSQLVAWTCGRAARVHGCVHKAARIRGHAASRSVEIHSSVQTGCGDARVGRRLQSMRTNSRTGLPRFPLDLVAACFPSIESLHIKLQLCTVITSGLLCASHHCYSEVK